MPVVRVEMLKGRSSEQKRQLIAGITAAVCEAIGVDDARVTVVLAEVEPDSWGSGGVPLADRAGAGV